MVQKYNHGKRPLKLYFTELGFSASKIGYSGVGSEEEQANRLSRLMLVLFDVRLRGIPLEQVHWYDLKQDDPLVGDYEANFGLISHNASRRGPRFRPTAGSRNSSTIRPISHGRKVLRSGRTGRRRKIGGLGCAARTVRSCCPSGGCRQRQSTPADFSASVTLELPEKFETEAVLLPRAEGGAAREAPDSASRTIV